MTIFRDKDSFSNRRLNNPSNADRPIMVSEFDGLLSPINDRLSYLENTELKIVYFESITAISGTINIPINATIILDDFQSGEDAKVESIINNEPTGEPPIDAGNNIISVLSFDAFGNYVLSGIPIAPIAFIYLFKIKLLYYDDNLDLDYVISASDLTDPLAASQAEVEAGIIDDKYVSPSTLTEWATNGAGGQTAFFTWKYSTNTAATDPGNGNFRGNAAFGASITKLYVDDLTTNNQVDISNLFARVNGDWLLHIQQRNDASKWIQFDTYKAFLDNTGWWTLDVIYKQSGTGGAITNLTDCLFTFVNKNNAPAAQGDTGCLTFASPGISIVSATTINIGAVTGWVVDNESTPGTSNSVYVSYPGGTNITVTTIAGGQVSYVSLLPDGLGGAIPVFTNSLPSSSMRKTHIWLGKVAHPNLISLTVAGDEPDYITSPLAFSRDLFQALGPYINDGVYPYPNGANLQINVTSGNIHGNGINFLVDRTTPNEVLVSGAPISFLPRTQTGAGGGAITNVDVGNYDVGGVVTVIPNPGATSTIRYIYNVPNLGFIIQYGQTLYSNLAFAIAAVTRESQIIYPNLIGNAILIGVLVVRKDATDLSNITQARFFPADKLGQIIGATAGIATGNLQTAYDNSGSPEIITNATLGAVTVQRGSAADSDSIWEGKDGAGTTKVGIKGDGRINQTSYTVATLPTGAQGDYAVVSDALAPTYLAIVIGGGTVVTPVFFNGVNWVAH